MLKRLFTREPPPPVEPVLDTDIAMNDMPARAARDRARDGDWMAAKTLLDATGSNWYLRGRRIGVLAAAAADERAWLDAWLAALPDDPSAVLLHAEALHDQASRARGGLSAANTTAEQFQKFDELSRLSAQVTHRAIELGGDDPTPWINLMGTYFADGHQYRTDFAETLAETTRRDPFSFSAHTRAVSFLCAKWYGSHEEMFAAARQVSAAAPPGAPAVMLPYLAHFEYAMREFGWDKRGGEAWRNCVDYLVRPEVSQELDAALAKWRAAPPPETGISLTCLHWATIGFVMRGRRASAKATFEEIGPYLGSTPAWGYFYSRQATGFLTAWRWANAVAAPKK